MLYENENIEPLYNPETGDTVEQEQRVREEEEIAQTIAEGQEFESLKITAGWKNLSAWLTQNVEGYTRNLVHEADEKKIKRLQEAIKSYSNVINFVEGKIKDAQILKQERTLRQGANPKE